MKQINLFFKTMLILCALVWSGNCAWADAVSSVTPENGKSYVIAVYVNNKYYALPNTTCNGSTISGTEVTLNAANKVNSSDAEGKTWTLEEGTISGQFYLKYTKGTDVYYLYKNGTGKSNYNFAINKTSKNYWEFTANGTGYTVSAVDRGSNNLNIQYNSNSFRCYSTATPIILLAIGDAVTGTTVCPTISGDTPFLESTKVTITNDASADGASIYYTLNGDDPTTTISATCFKYTAPFTIDATTTVKAIAKKSTDTNASAVVSKLFTKKNVISVSDAFNIIDNGTSEEKSDVFVQGRISKIEYINTDDGKGYATYWISVDGTTIGKQLKVYNGKYVDNVVFKSHDDIKVGDFVVVLGDLEKNSSTYEFVEGNYIVTHTPDSRIVTSLSWSSSEVEIDKGAAEYEYTLPTLNNPQNVSPIIYTITGTDNLAIEVDGVILVDTDVEGSVTVTATFTGNDDYKDATASYTITVIDRNKKGTINNPYTVADVIALNPTSTSSAKATDVYVKGYIVGSVNTSTGAIVSDASSYMDSNLALVDDPNDLSKNISVQLASKTDERTNFNVKDHPEHVGITQVLIKGDVFKYCGIPGLKNIDEMTKSGERVKISAVGLATYASDEVLDYTNVEDIEAYIAIEGEKGKVNLKRVKKVPAATGVLLRALNGKTDFDVPVTTAGADKVDGNAFVRGEGKAVESGKGPFNYILSKRGNEIGFYHANNNVVATNRAYLQLTTNNARLNLNFDEGELTGIEEVSTQMNETKDAMFDLQGRQVVKPAKGLYIKNGKRVVIK